LRKRKQRWSPVQSLCCIELTPSPACASTACSSGSRAPWLPALRCGVLRLLLLRRRTVCQRSAAFNRPTGYDQAVSSDTMNVAPAHKACAAGRSLPWPLLASAAHACSTPRDAFRSIWLSNTGRPTQAFALTVASASNPHPKSIAAFARPPCFGLFDEPPSLPAPKDHTRSVWQCAAHHKVRVATACRRCLRAGATNQRVPYARARGRRAAS
jgi:hypothetical protein